MRLLRGRSAYGGEPPESLTGDQPFRYRKRRGPRRYPSWSDVEGWRKRWTREMVAEVLRLLAVRASPEEIGKASGFGTLDVEGVHDPPRRVPDLRGLDLALLPSNERRLDSLPGLNDRLNLSYARLEGARLTDLDLTGANLSRAQLQKATLRRTKFTGALLTKAHLEDADLRDAVLDNTHLGHIRYTEDSFLFRGTVLMETHLTRALYVDPLLERYARDQYYLYVLKYRNRYNPLFRVMFFLWWLTSNYGRSVGLWFGWSALVVLLFWFLYLPPALTPNSLWAGFAGEWGPKLKVEQHAPGGYLTYLYFSVIVFATLGLGNVQPANWQAEVLVMLEVIAGYVMFGVLLSIVANKVARRA